MKRIAGRIVKHPAFYLVLILFISILVLNVKYPKIGRDYSYFVPRLLDSHLFYLNNGVQIQWWTPSFGGGLPSYPNPQQMQFSPAQFFLFTGNPWTAINLSVLMLISIGFFSTYLLFKQLSYPKDQAVLAATLFSTTAFYIEHLSVGHLGYLAFPLLPLVLLLLIHERLPVPAAAAGLALTIAFLSYSAGFYAAAIFVFAVPLSLLLIYLLAREVKTGYRHMLRPLAVASAGGIAGILISGSKLTAVLSHMRYFPRFIEVEYSANIFEALLGVLCQLFFTPIAVFFKRLDIETFFQDLVGTGPGMGVWEFDIGLSPIILAILLSSFFLLKKKRIKETTGRRKKTVLLVLILVLCWISLEITIADGIVYKYLKSMPLMKSLHVNARFASIFIMPVIILAMFFFRRLLERFTVKKVNAALLLAFLALVCYTEYVKIPGKHGALGFDVTQPVRDWTTIRRYHNDFEVKYNLPIRESKVFFARSSSLRLKEPVFGYRMGKFFPNLNITEGAVTGSDTDYYNMTHPASLVFPEENNLSLFERISRRDADNFKKFITYRVPQWEISKLQKISNRVSLVSAVLALLVLLFYLAGYIYKNIIRRKIQ